ncbi:beta-N-acetylhexosaminidase [Chitinophaga lutea]
MKKMILSAATALLAFTAGAQQRVSLIPEPSSIEQGTGEVYVTAKMKYLATSEAAEKAAALFSNFLEANYGLRLQEGDLTTATLIFSEDTALSEEAYQLTAVRNKIVLQGRAAGLFYGVQTLEQLIGRNAKGAITVPRVTIKDEPRFAYRGLMLDVGRYYFPVSYVKQFIDVMAHYKLNRFHWHLTEDQGWRIEIKKYPKLQTIASQRRETTKGHLREGKFDGTPHGGYYTQEEVKDIVQYAADRHITVVPEIEMPGHAQAALAAYPELGCTGGPYEVSTKWGVHKEVYCAGNDTVFTFLEDVLTEVLPLFPGQYVHIGGDECPKDRWKACAKCQARIKALGLKDEHELQSYFIRRMEKFLNGKGRKIIGWDEILEGGLAPDATVMSWRGEAGGIAAAQQKHDVIMTPNKSLYLDYFQGPAANEPLAIGGNLPLEKIYSYDPFPKTLTAEQQSYIKGVQANVWTEYIPNGDHANYMTYPRALALAEITWSPASKKNYARFRKALPDRLAALQARDVKFRIPEALGDEAVELEANGALVELAPTVTGARVYYTLDGSKPTTASKSYSAPFRVTQPATLQYIIVSGDRSSAVYTRTYTRKGSPKAVNAAGKQ